jgi:hypothetical protein
MMRTEVLPRALQLLEIVENQRAIAQASSRTRPKKKADEEKQGK